MIEKPADLVREPYLLDFLKIPEPYHLTETELERRIIAHLQQFLLELDKGFAFIGRQYRITLGNTHYYVDLVFYHRILKCFVLIDLKRGKVGYEAVGQMNMYLGYSENEENTEGDNPPVGISVCQRKRRTAGAVRHAQYFFAVVCEQVPALPAQPRRTANLDREPTQPGRKWIAGPARVVFYQIPSLDQAKI
jgi:hypothetical protein